jgi:hypothetical protein
MDVWPVRQELAARCYDPRSHLPLRLFWRGRRHSPVSATCDCGIHACFGIAGAAGYLDLYDDVPQLGLCHRAIGRVALWGTVVEGEFGWRASCAYPQRIFLPAEGAKGVGPEAVHEGLSVYGVPVDVLAGNRDAFIDQVDDAVREPES